MLVIKTDSFPIGVLLSSVESEAGLRVELDGRAVEILPDRHVLLEQVVRIKLIVT